MPPNPEFHNGKRPEDNSFVNVAFSATEHDDLHRNRAPPTTNSNAASPVAIIDPSSTAPDNNSVLTRRNSAGNSKEKKEKEQQQHTKHVVKSSGNVGDNNNNNNNSKGDKAMISCGSSVVAATGAPADALMDFDDLLPHIGEFGRYQKILFLLMIPFAFFVAWTYFSQIFLTLVPQEYHCALPELDGLLSSPQDR